MYCNGCGAKLSDGAKYCSRCGMAVVGTTGVDDRPVGMVDGNQPRSLYSRLIEFRRTTLRAVPTFALVVITVLAAAGVAYALFCVASDIIIPAFGLQKAENHSEKSLEKKTGSGDSGSGNTALDSNTHPEPDSVKNSGSNTEVKSEDVPAVQGGASGDSKGNTPSAGVPSKSTGVVGEVQGSSQPETGANGKAQQATSQQDKADNQEMTSKTGTYTYQSSFGFSVGLPVAWKGVATPEEQGHSSGVYHVEFYYKDYRGRALWRIDGMDNSSDDSSDVSPMPPNGGAAARELWELAHGGASSSPSMTKEDWASFLKLATGDGISAQDVESKESADAAEEAGNKAAQVFLEKDIQPTIKMTNSER